LVVVLIFQLANIQLKNWAAALADTDVMMKTPDHFKTFHLRGVIFLGLNKPVEALDSFHEVANINPKKKKDRIWKDR